MQKKEKNNKKKAKNNYFCSALKSKLLRLLLPKEVAELALSESKLNHLHFVETSKNA